MRKGDWMQTYTGKQFWPLDPRPEEVFIADIAHALANVCRFGGHCLQFYSVAQHSIIVSEIVPYEYALWGLLHDAAEAYLGDVIKPIKSEMTQYKDAEYAVLDAILTRFGLSYPEPKEVKTADVVALATEQRDIMVEAPEKWSFGADISPMKKIITPMTPTEAESKFLERFEILS